MNYVSMRTLITLAAFVLISFQTTSQNDEILVDTHEFDYLIGKTYYDVSELGDFEATGRGSTSYPDGKTTGSTNLLTQEYQIMTSEIVEYDEKAHQNVYKIVDIIVLNGYYSSCVNCLSSTREGIRVKTIHPYGNLSEDSILLTFEIPEKTGKFKQVNPKRFTWNKNSNRLRRN